MLVLHLPQGRQLLLLHMRRQLSDLLRHKDIETTQGTYAKNVPPAGPYSRFLRWMGEHEDWGGRLSPLVLGELMRT